jgi:pimeloyl-ACP methyl ester carboxylesterase
VIQDALLLTANWRIPLGQIDLPVSIWHGACDRTISVEASHALARRVPGSQLQIVSGQGHVSILHCFGSEILQWLIT